jgi:hypothetical protein
LNIGNCKSPSHHCIQTRPYRRGRITARGFHDRTIATSMAALDNPRYRRKPPPISKHARTEGLQPPVPGLEGPRSTDSVEKVVFWFGALVLAVRFELENSARRLTDRRCMPYCFRCLVLNDADISAPRRNREWLAPTAEFCNVHHRLPETVPASVFRLSNHFDAAHRAIIRYREKCLFRATGRLR